MPIQHKLILIAKPFYQVIYNFVSWLGITSHNQLRVLLYHDIPESQFESLYNQLAYLKNDWTFINPSQFEKMVLGDLPVVGKNLLVTFDDGMLSNLEVSKKILNPLDIKAIFFVITEFVKINGSLNARKFAAKYIMPNSSYKDIPLNWSNLQWEDLNDLIQQGHTIGHHTKFHTRLSECKSIVELEEEIFLSAKELENKLKVEVKHFAYTFGDVGSFSKEAMEVSKKNFNFVYSGLRGDNSKCISPFSIRRDAAATQLTNNEYAIIDNKLLEAFLSGVADFRYFFSRKKIDLWTHNSFND